MTDHNPLRAFGALADPTRQAIVQKLRMGPLAVGQLAAHLPISRPAVSQHLKVLSDAGLLVVETRGARRVYGLAPDGLRDIRRYLDALWDDALVSFAARAQDIADKETTKGPE